MALPMKKLKKLPQRAVSLDDFVSYLPMHGYVFLPTRELWPGSSVNSQFPAGIALYDAAGNRVLNKDGTPKTVKANAWLDSKRPVHQMTWAPGLPMHIHDRFVADGGWIEKLGVTCLNLYRPPPDISGGKASEAKPWLDHVRRVYPDDANHIISWLAHRVQRPEEKINHALFLGGSQGIGKDTMLEPVKRAVAPWNFIEVSPTNMLGRFNGYLKTVILRVSEARDLGESNRFAFNDHMKPYTAAPPDTLRVDEKNLREYYIFNCCGVIITSNYKTDGIYLSADDRRTYVGWSDCVKEEFSKAYWNRLWSWYEKGGFQHVAAYLAKLDISGFDAKAPPPKTPAFYEIVDANRAPELSELADVLDKMENPKATNMTAIMAAAGYGSDIHEWLDDRRNRRAIPHRLEKCGYTPVRNGAADDGLWKVNGARQVIYAKSDLSLSDRFKAASILMKDSQETGKKEEGEKKKAAAVQEKQRKKHERAAPPHIKKSLGRQAKVENVKKSVKAQKQVLKERRKGSNRSNRTAERRSV
jgi:hypothetical protein